MYMTLTKVKMPDIIIIKSTVGADDSVEVPK